MFQSSNVFILIWLLGVLACTPWLAFAQTRPNVIVIMTDDQGYGDIGLHGNTMLQTPALDALARQSLRLTNFHVDPTCAETRAALLTGQFPLRGGVWHTIMGRSLLRADAMTMPQRFQAAGYRTGMFGKWHLGDNYPYRPQDRGFETTLHHGGGGVGQTPDVWGNDYFDDVYWSGNDLQPVRGYCTDVFFAAAQEFITTESDKPFFCYLATNAPHGPYEVAQAAKQPYLDKGVSEPMASFYGMIANIDENLGRLLQLLDERQLAQETIVVFLTDNGTAAGYNPHANDNGKWQGFNAGMRGTKGQAYEGGHRVPCFIRFPEGKHAGVDFPILTAHVDLLPTLAELCQMAPEGKEQLDGLDILPLVGSPAAAAQSRTLVVQSHRVEVPQKWTKSVVLKDQWRLVDGAALFDLSQDPGQSRDIAAQHPELVAELRAAYENWWSHCAPDSADYVRIPLGTSHQDVVRLTAHDWHGDSPPWSQTAVRRQPNTNGTWQVTFERAGLYQFWLARQPLEEPIPLNCQEALVRVNGLESRVQLSPSAVLAPLTMWLPAGPASLSTELLNNGSATESTGAFFVYASYLGDELPQNNLPSWLSPGERIAWLGGTLIERAQESGALEAAWLSRAPWSGLTFCNLGWSGDDVRGRARNVFGDLAEGKSRRTRDLDLAAPSMVVIAYGMSEAFDTSISDEWFRNELAQLIAQQLQAGRRVALCRVPTLEFDSSSQTLVDWQNLVTRYNQRCGEFDAIIEELAQSLPGQVEGAAAITVLELPTLRTSWFEAAQHLSPQGYAMWSEQFATAAFGSESVITPSQTERIASLSQQAGRIFFDMHRPQNETYLTLFRKHEQGNNAVEAYQNRPLLADIQLQMLRAATRK